MENTTECIICFEPLQDDIVVLSCIHSQLFHYTCLSEWISNKKSIKQICPICEDNVEILNIINEKKPHKPFKENNSLCGCCIIL